MIKLSRVQVKYIMKSLGNIFGGIGCVYRKDRNQQL